MTILFAGGGTGGHVYPAIAIAEEIRKIDPKSRIVFAGTKKKIEARVVPQKGFEFHTIWISGFSRRLTLGNILFPVKVIVALFQSFFLIRSLKPDAVLGTGGYVSGPVVFIASLLGIPTIMHESNSYPGVTTRILASRVSLVFTTFDVTRKWLPPSAQVNVIGNPTREELSSISRKEGSALFGLDPEKPTVLAFGGSLGAASINNAMKNVAEYAATNDVQIIWQTGESELLPSPEVMRHPNVKIMKYVERMDCAYAAADLVVCRSGATTLAELTRLGKPAILVPYPYAAADHQTLNAGAMVESGAAVLIRDKDVSEKLLPEIRSLLSDSARRQEMSRRSTALGKPDAGREIARKIISMIR
jgi:UDP-N-acetylglucosamine--N-acetylmuramyl-(pentapeptide) pyrophosphoryl-undecaprenol N-acetylglucosamine transferase